MSPYIGTIQLFAGDYAPWNWMLCDGRDLQISQWTVLFAIIGVQFGGDGVKTFKLPKLDGPQDPNTKVRIRYVICVQGTFPEKN